MCWEGWGGDLRSWILFNKLLSSPFLSAVTVSLLFYVHVCAHVREWVRVCMFVFVCSGAASRSDLT